MTVSSADNIDDTSHASHGTQMNPVEEVPGIDLWAAAECAE